MKLHLTRGVLMVPMAFLFFWGLGPVPLAQAIALAFIAPLIALYLAAVLLHEPDRRRAMAALPARRCRRRRDLRRPGAAPSWARGAVGSLAILASACLYAFNIILDAAAGAGRRGRWRSPSSQSCSAVIGFWLAAPVAGCRYPAAAMAAVAARALLAFAGRCCCSPGPMRGPRRSIWRRSNIPASSGPPCSAGSCFGETVSAVHPGRRGADRRRLHHGGAHARVGPCRTIETRNLGGSVMAWVWLILGGLFEVGFTTSLRFVDGFRNIRWTIAFLVSVGDQHGAARASRAHHPDGHGLCGVGRDRRGRDGDRRHRLSSTSRPRRCGSC